MDRGIAARPPTPSVERPTTRVDGPHAADELGQVVREHDRPRVLIGRRSSRQPGLHRPWKRVTRSGFAEATGSGVRNRVRPNNSWAACASDSSRRRVAATSPGRRKPGYELVAKAKQRIHRPLRSDLPDG
jgi:hypothetical protein